MAVFLEILKALIPLLVQWGFDVLKKNDEAKGEKRERLKSAKDAWDSGDLSSVADHLSGRKRVRDETKGTKPDSGN